MSGKLDTYLSLTNTRIHGTLHAIHTKFVKLMSQLRNVEVSSCNLVKDKKILLSLPHAHKIAIKGMNFTLTGINFANFDSRWH